ncbi:hypothetical protein EUGRSUZ_D00631 [Eucalyptus grandis]|uniref:Uncharacterized protein n=2 Tax=Eucalyptus grandis TaxID=71139 RepID=A0ACC3L3C2_EUCGR|nr:hypothetical protein EUGRSUZ_D00631 [Eucalyptus grandis]
MGLRCCNLAPTEPRIERCSEAGEPTDLDLRGGIAGTLGSSSEGGTMASSDMGGFGQDMPGEARPDHRDLSMASGWDMDPDGEGHDNWPASADDNPGVSKEPAPIPRFPDDPYDPPLSQWRDQFMYCSPMSCQGRKDDYGPGAGGDCMGFSMLIEYPSPPPSSKSGVSRNPVHSPNGAKPDGHTISFTEPLAFPPESHATGMPEATWEEPMMPGH